MINERNTVKILGFGVDSFSFEQAVEYISSACGQIVTINPEMIDCALNNDDFAQLINSADLVVPDGIGVEIGLKILGHNVRRIPGIELGMALIKKFSEEGKTVAFVGAKPGVAESAVSSLKSTYKNLNVVYCHDGYFENDEDILNEIISVKPDLVLVALGSPKQEFFGNKLKKNLENSVIIGLGGSFDVWAGVVERAPKIYQRLGIEWLYRTVREPKRFKRIFPTLPIFVLRVIKERLFN